MSFLNVVAVFKSFLMSIRFLYQDDLMAELEELEQENLDEQLLEVTGPATDNLPSVPTAEPVVPTAGKLSSINRQIYLNTQICILTLT